MRLKFWGVRGSIPTPERRNSHYGGNTSCLELRLENGTLIILDCGSGIRALGKSLAREFGERPIQGLIFLTHFHWDHIQGIPFFLPLYRKGNMFLFHSVEGKGREMTQAIEGQMSYPYFPVDLSVMAAVRNFYDVGTTPINLNGAIISSAPLNHPQGCLAYRIEADGGVLVYATDTEPGSPEHDRALRELAFGADVIVYDAQYTPEQLAGEKKTWGHSSWLEGTRIARECGVKQLVLFHHDPDHDDAFVDGLVEQARRHFPNVCGAAEGMEIDVGRGKMEATASGPALDRRQELRYRVELPVELEWQSADGRTQEALGATRDLSNSGIYLLGPREISKDNPPEIEITLPSELERLGQLAFHFVARPIRQERANGSERLGIAARISASSNASKQLRTISSARPN